MKHLLLSTLALFMCFGAATAQDCGTSTTPGARDIGSFCSLPPTGQSSQLELPEGYRFQLLFKEGRTYTDGSGVVPGRNDFAGFVPNNGSSETGHLSVNHELTPGGVSMLSVSFDAVQRLWVVDDSRPVDFSGIGGTGVTVPVE